MTLAITRIDGWSVATDGDAPRIRDVELGERLGFTRPVTIRDLIKRLTRDGKLKDVRCVRAVRRQSTGLGRTRELVVNEFWLTQRQAIKVITKSETAIADQILEEVIDVFEAYLRGQLVAPVAPQQVAVPVPQNSPTLGDLHRDDIKTRCTQTARCTRTTVHRVHGCLRKRYHVSGVYQINAAHYDRVCWQLERWEHGDEALPSNGSRLLKAAADSAQCELPFPKTKRGAR